MKANKVYKIAKKGGIYLYSQQIRRAMEPATRAAKTNDKPTSTAYILILILIYLLIAIGLSTGGSTTVHIYTQTIYRTIQNKKYIEQQNNFGRVGAVPHLG